MYQTPQPWTKYAGYIAVAEAFRQKVRKNNEQKIKSLEERSITIPPYITNVEVVGIEGERATVYGEERRGLFSPIILYHLVYDLKNGKIVEKDFFEQKMFWGLGNILPSRRQRYKKTSQWYKETTELKRKIN